MALKWLGGGKPDHPFADEKGAKEIFDALAADEPAKAIEDIRHWIESVNLTEGFKPERRAELNLLLDEAAQVHQRKLARDYLSGPRMSAFQETRLRGALHGLWKDIAAGYAACLDQFAPDTRLKAQLPLLCTRAMRALAAQLKWRYMHYEPGEAAEWEMICKAYRFAELKKAHRDTVTLHPGVQTASTAEREFLKALMLATSSPDCLMPLDIELAERIVAHFSGAFLIGDAPKPQETHHWIDLAGRQSPKRLTQTPTASAGLRYFAAGTAAAALDGAIRILEGGAIPSDMALGGSYEPARVLGVCRHLKMYWAATPPVRKDDRYAVKHRLAVVNGFDGVLARLRDGAGQAAGESWVTENISAGGIGAVIDSTPGDWLGIGKMVGLSVEGGSGACSLGIVHRCNRIAPRQVMMGIRTLAKASFAVSLDGDEAQDGLLLNDDRTLREEALVCLREGGFDKRTSQKLAFDDANYLLIPVGIKETGEGFEIARYRVMQQG